MLNSMRIGGLILLKVISVQHHLHSNWLVEQRASIAVAIIRFTTISANDSSLSIYLPFSLSGKEKRTRWNCITTCCRCTAHKVGALELINNQFQLFPHNNKRQRSLSLALSVSSEPETRQFFPSQKLETLHTATTTKTTSGSYLFIFRCRLNSNLLSEISIIWGSFLWFNSACFR